MTEAGGAEVDGAEVDGEREGGALIGDRYRLLELIGRGGMGRVWRGRDERLGRDVAVKEVVLPPGVGEEQRAVLFHRVVREARAAARLNHPGIITVHDVVEHEGAPIIVMEYVTGPSLASALAKAGRLPVTEVAQIGVKILKALSRAHASGIVHRDLKPDNVLLTDDRVVITDFGIAHMADATLTLTHTGTLIGTPAYMAPEQLEGEPPTPAGDLWALGATLYSALEGRPPFSADTYSALCVAIVTKEPPVPRRAGPLAPVLAALLTKDPGSRAGADEALAALEAVLRGAEATGLPARTAPTRRLPPVEPVDVPPVEITAAEVVAAPQTPGPLLLRAAGCFALVWLGTVFPWNEVRGWHGYPRELLISVTAGVIALVNAVLRPRWPAAPVWLLFIAVNTGLFLGVTAIWPLWAFGGVLLNALMLGTCCWLLWWFVPRRDPAGRRG
ncbi:serine/threonine-protein kinase [Streptomyces sp. A1136]|uniref:serine/threonine-protein kinase n=1 Tax=Streptomyces sp. A1136 TaxID=2563102 RepID=UPI00109E731F|nr:serine/threonine-protein kinase [Streptomyces sp. A1136]THA56647.1 serine/threonine protein kinase [Streptomyces sp. A1136]